MTHKTLLRSLLIPALLGGAPLLANQVDDDAPINMDLERAPLQEVLRSFAAISGGELIAEGDLEGTVTIELEQVPWKEALGRICAEHRLSCELLGGARPALRVRRAADGTSFAPGLAGNVNLSLKSASLREVLSTFGIITGREVILDEAITGNLSIELHDAPLPVLIEEICALSGCLVEWGDGVIRLVASAASVRRSDLVLAGADLAAALQTAVALPAFEPFGPPEIDLAEELRGAGPIELDLRDATWMEILQAICETAECRFKLHYGLPGRLEVLPADLRLAQSVTLDGSETTLEAAAAELAAVHGLEARLGPDLDPAAAVRLPAEAVSWRKALHLVCRQVSCSGKIEGDELVVTSRVEPLASHPISGTEGVELGVRFEPHAGEVVGGEVRFTWTRSLHALAAAGDPRLLQLSWIPFGPDLQVVLPILGRCDGGDGDESGKTLTEIDVLEPVRLPLAAPRSWRRGEAVIELGVPLPGGGTPAPSRPAESCLRPPAGRAEASFFPRPRGAAAAAVTATLPDRLGAYLLVTPPGVGPAPMAAVVTLGSDPAGARRLALVRPRADGSGAEVELLSLDPGEVLRETLRAPDGREFDLELSLGAE
jgi:hypothetical protein